MKLKVFTTLFNICVTLTFPPLNKNRFHYSFKIKQYFYSQILLYERFTIRKVCSFWGKIIHQFSLFIIFLKSQVQICCTLLAPHHLSELDMPGWWSWRTLRLHQHPGASIVSFCGSVFYLVFCSSTFYQQNLI